jgi:hypothetical protein
MIDRRIRRQFKLLQLLRSQDLTSAKELAGRCQVNIRTVYRDIEDLLQAGFPIEGMPGPEGGYRLTQGAAIDASVFGDVASFYAFLLKSSHDKRDTDVNTAPAIESSVGNGSDWLQLALEGKLHIVLEDERCTEVAHAIFNAEAILIRRKLNREGTRTLQEEVAVPLGLVLQLHELNLVARDLTGNIFTEQLTEVESVTALGLSFKETEALDVSGWWSKYGQATDSARAAPPRSKRR